MIQKLKYAGLLAILPLFMVSIAPDYISLADAATGAYVERSAITQKGDNSYEVVFQIFAGTEALPEGKLLVTSDVSSNEVLFRSVSAESLTSAQTKIIANDPNSISAVIFTPATSSVRNVTPQTDGVAYVELFTMNQEGDNAYDVVFKIYAGDEALIEFGSFAVILVWALVRDSALTLLKSTSLLETSDVTSSFPSGSASVPA